MCRRSVFLSVLAFVTVELCAQAQAIADDKPSGIRVYIMGDATSYVVYGGDLDPIDDDSAYEIALHPEENGYHFLGNAISTHEFYGSYFYYLIMPVEINYEPIQVDAFEFLGASDCFWDPIGCHGPDEPWWYAMNFFDPPCDEWPTIFDCPQNCQGPPDGEYSCLYGYSFIVGMVCGEPPPENQRPVASFKSLNVTNLGHPEYETTNEGYHMVGGVIRFDASESYDLDPGGTIQSYQWNFDGGERRPSSPDQKPDVVFKEAKVYTITLVVIDNMGMPSEQFTETLDLRLQKGDLIFLRSGFPYAQAFDLIGNFYTHVGMYIGDQQMIESIKYRSPRSNKKGVVITPLSGWSYPSETYAVLMRVRTANDKIIQDAIDFAMEKVRQQQQYDTRLWQKSLDQRNYYCSELIWAAYYSASQGSINLGLKQTGGLWDWFTPVSPDDMIIHDNVNFGELIGFHQEFFP